MVIEMPIVGLTLNPTMLEKYKRDNICIKGFGKPHRAKIH